MKGIRARTTLLKLERDQRDKQKAAWKHYFRAVNNLVPFDVQTVLDNGRLELVVAEREAEIIALSHTAYKALGLKDSEALDSWSQEVNEAREAYERGELWAMPDKLPHPPFDPTPILERARELEYSNGLQGGVLALVVLMVVDGAAVKALSVTKA